LNHFVHELVKIDSSLPKPLLAVFHVSFQNPISTIKETDVQPYVIQLAKPGRILGKGETFLWDVIKTYGGTL
jgi:hypothetical protein